MDVYRGSELRKVKTAPFGRSGQIRSQRSRRVRGIPPACPGREYFFVTYSGKAYSVYPCEKVQSLQTNTGFECTEVAPKFAE